jgi:GNAT superfamily N-acetyltransferase
LGVFCTVVPGLAKDFEIETLATAHPVETDRADQAKSVLLAHIIATASNSRVVQDSDMEIPADWRASQVQHVEKGHREGGRTICVHSLAVSPKLQGCGLGKLIMKAFLQQMKNLGAERVALICQNVRSPSCFLQKLGSHRYQEKKKKDMLIFRTVPCELL